MTDGSRGGGGGGLGGGDGGGGKNGTGGTSYNPTALGNQFGNKLSEYLSHPAPVFGQSGYVPPGAATLRGQDMMSSWAGNGDVGSSLNNSYWQTNNLVRNGGLTDAMRGNIDTTNGIGGLFGQFAQSGGLTDGMNGDIGTVGGVGNAYGQMAGSAQNPSLTEQRFGNASYGNNDPGYQTLRSKLANDVTTQNLSAFNNSGMFGSDTNRSSLAEGLGNALGGMDSEQYRYGQGLERQDVANIDAQRQQGFNNRMGALGAQMGAAQNRFGMGQQGINNRMGALSSQLGAAQSGFGMGQQGLTNQVGAQNDLAQRFQDSLMPGQTMAGIGALQDQDARARRAGEAELFDRTNNADYNRFQQLLSAFSGSQQNAGMGETVPWWQQALGFGTQLAGSFF